MNSNNNQKLAKNHNKKIHKLKKNIKKSQYSANRAKVIQPKDQKAQQNIIEDQININQEIRSSQGEVWTGLPPEVMNNDSLMLIGLKNTGKSMLAKHIYHFKNADDTVILDCDIGQNQALEGCVSLTSENFQEKIWIGELSPLNNISTYLSAIKYSYEYYRQHFFTKKLIINTMGYLTGLGEILIYQIYNIVQPQNVIFLESGAIKEDQTSIDYKIVNKNAIFNIKDHLQTGSYIERLHITASQNQNQKEPITKISCKIYHYINAYAQKKKHNIHFQSLLPNLHSSQRISNIAQIISIIKNYQRSCSKSKKQSNICCIPRQLLNVYQQSKHNKSLQGIDYSLISTNESLNLQIVVVGEMLATKKEHDGCIEGKVDDSIFNLEEGEENQMNNKLLRVIDIGYAFEDKIYFFQGKKDTVSMDSKQVNKNILAVVSEGIDFQKSFYHLNQNQIIELELRYGRIMHLNLLVKALGSKGVRNNPSKKA